jgi:hypothetical protein
MDATEAWFAQKRIPTPEEVLQHYAIKGAVWGWQRQAMPLGSMVSFILQGKPCECEALCTCDQPRGS